MYEEHDGTIGSKWDSGRCRNGAMKRQPLRCWPTNSCTSSAKPSRRTPYTPQLPTVQTGHIQNIEVWVGQRLRPGYSIFFGSQSRLSSAATRPQLSHTNFSSASLGAQMCRGSADASPQYSHEYVSCVSPGEHRCPLSVATFPHVEHVYTSDIVSSPLIHG